LCPFGASLSGPARIVIHAPARLIHFYLSDELERMTIRLQRQLRRGRRAEEHLASSDASLDR
jgi:hypothetical protein